MRTSKYIARDLAAGRGVNRNRGDELSAVYYNWVILKHVEGCAHTNGCSFKYVCISTTNITFEALKTSQTIEHCRERHRCHKLFSIYVVVLRRRSGEPSTNCSYGLSPSIVRGQTHAGGTLGASLTLSYFLLFRVLWKGRYHATKVISKQIALEYNGKQIATWLLSSGKESAFGMGGNVNVENDR
ncbi:hypothetical protein EVAR_99811_1 [Eumeta japonica]|uniref:Uncharacterized protein n=1 Tax=Eumeta variegata TaxID=151549 RepID=A0A4C2AD74_EUMVA|nr:hypothetical protein EVAR_99811_1 [Eumeta japonica]